MQPEREDAALCTVQHLNAHLHDQDNTNTVTSSFTYELRSNPQLNASTFTFDNATGTFTYLAPKVDTVTYDSFEFYIRCTKKHANRSFLESTQYNVQSILSHHWAKPTLSNAAGVLFKVQNSVSVNDNRPLHDIIGSVHNSNNNKNNDDDDDVKDGLNLLDDSSVACLARALIVITPQGNINTCAGDYQFMYNVS